MFKSDKKCYKLNLNNAQGFKYYCQVQGQLYCTERETCFFVIYSETDFPCIVLKIIRDNDFINNVMLKNLSQFYNDFYEEAMLQKYLFKSL